jgi:hypothetical protein
MPSPIAPVHTAALPRATAETPCDRSGVTADQVGEEKQLIVT